MVHLNCTHLFLATLGCITGIVTATPEACNSNQFRAKLQLLLLQHCRLVTPGDSNWIGQMDVPMNEDEKRTRDNDDQVSCSNVGFATCCFDVLVHCFVYSFCNYGRPGSKPHPTSLGGYATSHTET